VDALAHAVARVKDSLISDIAENRSMHRQAQLDHWARTPLRYGGLGDSDTEEYKDTHRAYMGQYGGVDKSYGEALIEEDEVLIALEERRDRLQEVVNEDLSFGRKPDLRTVDKIRALTEQIKELKEVQVF
jgi:hypothetical protein